MKWIKSGGGPLVCIEKDIVTLWNGVGDPRISGNISDYDRACEVQDYVGILPINGREALVLGDMPLQTLVWSPERSPPIIVRVFYADPETDVGGLISNALLDFSAPMESLIFEARFETLLVFDSALMGASPKSHLSFHLSKGKYTILTKRFELDDRTSVLLHKFEPITL